MKRQILSIARKELNGYFGSPLAIIFLGTFLATILFIFFTIETFFARGIADVRPLFRWMPILLIFLLAALTMRQWSEEQRSGTQELLLTLPVPIPYLVLGKFLAVMAIISLALALTLPLPISIAIIGNLDWGPVIGGYLAALLMAGSYAAIGLFVSSRTDNQIVALISTVLLGGLFYLIGTRGVTDFAGGKVSEILWAIGTGSRFESIQRGVIDLRDLIYYLSLIAFFLMLNTIALDMTRWSSRQQNYRRTITSTAILLGLNLILFNVWLFPLQGLRVDLTAQKEYSLSPTTKDLFDNLQEPLLIRAYISEKTHPLLAPLAPQIRDMLREYEIASKGRVTTELIDPLQEPEIEAEANQLYGIRPTPFQVANRYEASVINSYFDILVRYGDQTVVLNFQDLIEVNTPPSGEIDVRLRNLEYDLTRAIKKVVFGFQSLDAVLAALDKPVKLTFYVTPDTLPESLTAVPQTISDVANAIAADSNGKFIYEVVNLDDPNSPITPQFLQKTYGLQPIPTAIFSPDTFYAHMILQNGEKQQLLYPPADVTEADIRATIESALKRSSTGFLKVVGLWTPPNPALQNPQMGGMPSALVDYSLVREQLGQEYTVRNVDLSTGRIPSDVDVLLIIGPQNLTDTELFAIDQFLMHGGAVTLAFSHYQVAADQFSGGLSMQPVDTDNLLDWLAQYGISSPQGLVMDMQNQPFPVAVTRQANGFQVQEIQAVDYPFFVDVRPDGMNTDTPILANLPAVTLNWATPIELDTAKNDNRETTVFLHSSPRSWLYTANNILPDFTLYPDLGFAPSDDQQSFPLAVALQGRFESYFKDKPSPLTETTKTEADAETGTKATAAATIVESPESSRLVVIGSTAFVEDSVMSLSSRLTQDRYLNNLQFLQNTVDWSAEDLDLLAIRSRGSSVHVLQPMTRRGQAAWETANYIIALAALLGIYGLWRARRKAEHPIDLIPVAIKTGE